ncbi:MAG: hypothetical protein ACI9OH_003592 [Oleispira sp.]|jgi:hypothetical protein
MALQFDCRAVPLIANTGNGLITLMDSIENATNNGGFCILGRLQYALVFQCGVCIGWGIISSKEPPTRFSIWIVGLFI